MCKTETLAKWGARVGKAGLILAILFTALFAPVAALGKVCVLTVTQADDSIEDENVPIFVPPPRELLRPMTQASKAIEKQDYPRAIALLGEILQNDENEDYLMALPDREGKISRSLRATAAEMLGSIPAKEREVYQLRYGIPAEQMLEEAISENDYLKISQIVRRFFYTEAGYTAAMLLGHHHLEQGRPIASAFAFQRVIECEQARKKFDPEASILLATCWALADSEVKAVDVLKDLRQRNRTVNIRFMDQVVQLPRKDDQLGQWLTDLIGKTPLMKNRAVGQWVIYRGNPQRNAYGESGFPLRAPRWEVPVHNDLDIENAVRRQQEKYVYTGDVTVPAVQPIAVGDTIVMRTFNKLVGIDFKTGKRTWVFPSFDTDLLDTGDIVANQRLNARVLQQPITERMWQDTVFGQVSSDGERIFLIPNPGFAKYESTRIVISQGRKISDPLGQRDTNELKAIDVSRQGSFLWEVGGETGKDEPKLAGAFFLGPPLPLDNVLYSVCQMAGEIRVVAMEPASGRMLWSQQLASTQGRNASSQNENRRLAGASPSFSDGILVCPTNVGAVVAMELSTRSLLWGYQHSHPNAAVSQISPTQKSGHRRIGGYWRDSMVTIANGKVVYTPVDKQELVCLDLSTGLQVWKSETGVPRSGVPRKDSIYVGCIDAGQIVLVGVDHARGIDIETGIESWEIDTQQYGRPSGRGYGCKGSYFYPTTDKRILRLDIEKGVVAQDVPTNDVLGNLICYQGDVISHGATTVTTFPQDETSAAMVKKAKALDRMTPELWVLDAQLLMQKNELREAVSSIEQAHTQKPSVLSAKILAELMIQSIRSDFEFGMQLAKKYPTLLKTENQSEFLVAKIDGMIERGESELALDEIQRLLEPADQFLAQRSERFVNVPEEAMKIRIDRWVSLRLNTILQNGTDEQKSNTLERLADTINRSTLADAKARFELYRIVGLANVPAEQVFELGRELVSKGFRVQGLRSFQFLETLSSSRSKAKQDLAATAGLELVRLYQDANDLAGMADQLAKVKSLMDENSAAFSPSQREQVTDYEQFLADKPSSDLDNWPTGKAYISNSGFGGNDTEKSGLTGYRRSNILNKGSSRYRGEYQLDGFTTNSQFQLIGADGNVRGHWFPNNDPASSGAAVRQYGMEFDRADLVNGLLTSAGYRDFQVVDWLNLLAGESNEKVALWSAGDEITSEPFVQPASVSDLWGITLTTTGDSSREIEIAASGRDGICFLKDSSLICVDPFSGKQVWKRNGLTPGSRIYGDEEFVVVFQAANRETTAYEIRSGEQVTKARLRKELGFTWAHIGRHFLQSNLVDGKPTMFFYDPVTKQTVWQRNFAANTKACVFQESLIGVYTPERQFELIDIETGKTILQTQLNVPNATAVDIRRVQDDYLIILHTGRSSSGSGYRYLNDGEVEIQKTIHLLPFYTADLMRIDGQSGMPEWKFPARFEDFQFCSSQPRDCNVLTLSRRLSTNSLEQDYTQYAFIDLRNGKYIGEVKISGSIYQFPRISVKPDSQTVSVTNEVRQTDIRFSNDPQPPRATANLTNSSLARFPKPEQSTQATIASERASRSEILAKLNARMKEQEKRQEEMKRRFKEEQKKPIVVE